MSFSLFDAPLREPSQFVGFAGNRIDRQSEKRDDQSALRALDNPGARLLVFAGTRVLLAGKDDSLDPLFDVTGASRLGADLSSAILLGVDENGPLMAVPSTADVEALPEGIQASDNRSIVMQGLLDESTTGALAQGAALLSWHATHRFCGKCGAQTEMRAGGYKRLCGSCGTEHFPRTDPVAIMLTVTRDRCLLGRGKHFAPGMYSALAGFIEPGETIEAAVRRETLEEAGIRLGRVVYHASQPWPFPYSLMIGCFGEALNEDIHADEAELEACRWFSREEVFQAMEKTHPDGIVTPPAGAIAHNLIRHWAESA